MTLVQIMCTNPDCPGYEVDEDGVVTGHTYLATKVAATRIDPGYIEGTCDKCGEESETYEVEQLSDYDIEYLKAMHGPGGDRI